MKKFVVSTFILLLLSNCQKMPMSSKAPIEKPTDNTSLATVMPTASYQSTFTPFPTLESISSGEIAYIVAGENKLYVTDGKKSSEKVTTFSMNIYGAPVWSPNKEYIAFDCSLVENEEYISRMCLFETRYLGRENAENYTIDITLSDNLESSGNIDSVSWSPDAKMLAVFLRDRGLCVITISAHAVDCGISNYILNGFSDNNIQTMLSAASLAWSPTDKNTIIFSSPSSVTVGKIFAADLNQNRITELEPPINLFALGDKIAWSPGGKQIAFTYTDSLGVSDNICQNDSCLYTTDGKPNLGIINIDGSGFEHILDGIDIFYRLPPSIAQYHFPIHSFFPPYFQFSSPSWSPDGRYITIEVDVARGGGAIGIGAVHSGMYIVDLETRYFYPLWDFTTSNSAPNWSGK